MDFTKHCQFSFVPQWSMCAWSHVFFFFNLSALIQTWHFPCFVVCRSSYHYLKYWFLWLCTPVLDNTRPERHWVYLMWWQLSLHAWVTDLVLIEILCYTVHANTGPSCDLKRLRVKHLKSFCLGWSDKVCTANQPWDIISAQGRRATFFSMPPVYNEELSQLLS